MTDTPTTAAPRTLPVDKENNCLRLLCTYLLYERRHETAMSTMVEGLIVERHHQFHDTTDMVDRSGTNWRDCRNQVCVNARMLLDQAKEPEVELNEFAVQLMGGYTINFQPRVVDHQMLGIKARLVEIAELFKAVRDTPNNTTPEPNTGVIIP